MSQKPGPAVRFLLAVMLAIIAATVFVVVALALKVATGR